uniref:Secreted protein n=1 Tax=Lactuca sativa TaxID=4236 RepID=A0A9R1XT50_LACSA|nr:hypothetical protein LSAT_V11C300125470 [Lactuca sativa]
MLSVHHRFIVALFSSSRLLVVAVIGLPSPLSSFFQVRKAGDPGNHNSAIFPRICVYNLNSSSKDTILHIVTTIKQEGTFCVRYMFFNMFLYFHNV